MQFRIVTIIDPTESLLEDTYAAPWLKDYACMLK